MFENRLLNSFLEDSNVKTLYGMYLEKPSPKIKACIEELFQLHVRKIQILSYFSKTLYFESQKFDKKIRFRNKITPLILDKNISDDEDAKLIDLIECNDFSDFEVISNNSVMSTNLECLFEDKQLYNIVSNLTSRQKDILYYIFVRNLTEEETAIKLGISKQAVNKTKNQTLKKIKRIYNKKSGGDYD